MAGLDLGDLLGDIEPGIVNGATSGLKYIGQFVSSFIWSAEHAVVDSAPLTAQIVIAKMFLAELMDESENVLPSVVKALFSAQDPFAGSRHAYEAWRIKWPH